ncbi:MAG: GNAT family N-acetyltransferase [Smithellaceae bacterium]
MKDILYRQDIRPDDVDAIERIVRSSGFFSASEIVIACELAADRLEHGKQSTYEFVFAEISGQVSGYTCYGLIPATVGSFDLYWIAVSEAMRGIGLGKALLFKTEALIQEAKGQNIYAETSSRAQYEPTHRFYESCGYRPEATLLNFYAEGDSKIIYTKTLD